MDAVRTECNFGKVFGQIAKVIGSCKSDAILIRDPNSWGHVSFFNECKKKNKTPILGISIAVVEDQFQNKNKTPDAFMTFVARNNEGLKELYRLFNTANKFFYYQPRLSFEDVRAISSNISVIAMPSNKLEAIRDLKHIWLEANPSCWRVSASMAVKFGWNLIAMCDNYFPKKEDKIIYEVISPFFESKNSPMHILDASELKKAMPGLNDYCFEKAWGDFRRGIDVSLPKAENVKINSAKTLMELCEEGAIRKRIDLSDATYAERLKHELDLIKDKKFEDYFFLIADLCIKAKEVMLVGPARGSSSGSLVCYLIGITEVDPIQHGLLFSRFLEPTRQDPPDIDIDFPDKEWVFSYLQKTYGYDNVAHIGTTLTYQAKSAITDVGKALGIPAYELTEIKEAVIDRMDGDERALMCVRDTFESVDIGKALIKKYPNLIIAADIEGHKKTSGVHAAGIIVCNDSVSNYCGVTGEAVACIDKRDAEKLNILKIDALGLRTLLVLQDALKQINKTNEFLYSLPIDDADAFKIINNRKFSGIFQFEGQALQAVAKRMPIENFNDIVSVTSLARPGPMMSGATETFILRRIGEKEVSYSHPLIEPHVNETLGVVTYQEQVMSIVNQIGGFSWDETSTIRKGISKSLGDEFFSKYEDKFVTGCADKGISRKDATEIWQTIRNSGAYLFNKSHGVAYGLVSYWCCWFKAHYPLEFAAATLRNLKEDEQAVKILRELVKEGFEYIPFDPQLSEINWSVKDGKLVGGWLGVKGVGEKKAQLLKQKIKDKLPLSEAERKIVNSPAVLWKDIFECERRFGHLYENPEAHKLTMAPTYINDVSGKDGAYIIIGKIVKKDVRDANEYQSLQRRGGRVLKHHNLWLSMVIADDTDEMKASISRSLFEEIGKDIAENCKVGDWLLLKGKISGGYRDLKIEKVRRLS